MVYGGFDRADADTWDLAASVGATATMVAAGRARATRAGLIEDRFAERLAGAVGIDFFARWAAGELDAAEVDIPGQWGLQAMTNLLTVRTRYIDRFVAESMTAGIEQVVILASGLDARGYRLHWPAGVRLFEVDQPRVIEFKQETLAVLGAEPAVELRAVPIDLRHGWPAALCDAGFDPTRRTAWVVEGLLRYLPPDAQDKLLDDVTALSCSGSRLAVEAWGHSAEIERDWQKTTNRWYQHGLDAELDNLCYYGQNDAATYLRECGWRTVSTPVHQLLTELDLVTHAVAGSEFSSADTDYFCTAEWSGGFQEAG